MSRRRRARRPVPTTDKRPPEVRLEAMVREPNRERAHRMMKRILEDLEANPQAAPWLAGARALWERLVIGEDSWYYLADRVTECLLYTQSDQDARLVHIRDEMEAIQAAHGLGEDEGWLVHEGPEEWQALNRAWEERADDIVNDYLRESGHADVAELREQNREEFEGRSATGRIELFGRDEEWDFD